MYISSCITWPCICFLPTNSHFLYTISHPSKSGIPSIDLSKDEETIPIYASDITYKFQSLVQIDRVLTKAINASSHLKPVVNKRLRSLATAKLWRMGKALAKTNSRQHQQQLERWKKMEWKLILKPIEVQSALIQEKKNLQLKKNRVQSHH